MVYRIYVEKKNQFDHLAKNLADDIRTFLGIKNLDSVKIINRYDVENVDLEVFEKAKTTIFSEPQVDNLINDLIIEKDEKAFIVEYLPGQFDQRASSAEECLQIISQGERPIVKTAKVYILKGNLKDSDLNKIKKYVINPIESRECDFREYKTLKIKYDIPTKVEILDGFIDLDKKGLADFISQYRLAMDLDDISFCQNYFKDENRNPSITEIRMIDTYWSDHCRHTTFLTSIDSVVFEDKLIQETYQDYLKTRENLNIKKPISLMNLATIIVKYLKSIGKLDKLDESEEINACTVKFDVEIDGKKEPWLLLFKNETHNHPTEIEPFGGAATCIGGAIRDPLSGRAYVYGAMRVTGAANPLKSLNETIKGKLPQRKIITTAANGYSSYGNQIGLATGIVDEIYHDGYAAKRMEIGAVIGATPEKNVVRERPIPGDIIVLLGGKTGRDGCGGATGSSKSHTVESLETCGSEVQKGNAPEERKLQRLFRNAKASKMIKRCNDFGAGGVSVAIGELADGLDINLNAVPKKYEGLDATELAISESQERMAVVISPENVEEFIKLANSENIQATVVAKVKKENRLTMTWNDKVVVDISRDFLNTNGAEKHVDVVVKKSLPYKKDLKIEDFETEYSKLVQDLNVCSKRGLAERFDSTIGAGSVIMPFGGKYQRTPAQAMIQRVSTEKSFSNTCSIMTYGYNPFVTEKSPYHGAYLAVVESISKVIAQGGSIDNIYLTFQEYFERLDKDSERWGKPLSALLGAFKAQKDFEIASIGGKDSMSGTFEKINVPPTLVSFAVGYDDISNIVTNEFKGNSKVYIVKAKYNEDGLPDVSDLIKKYRAINKLISENKILSTYAVSYGGVAEAVFKMCLGNHIGFKYDKNINLNDIFEYNYGSIILEISDSISDLNNEYLEQIGQTQQKYNLEYSKNLIKLEDLEELYENKLESVFKCNNVETEKKHIEDLLYNKEEIFSANIKVSKPKVLIPVFPGTNCEYDSAKAVEKAGALADIFVINNLDKDNIARSVEEFAKKIKESQMIFIPGGFSGGDEPEGSGKFITAFFRNLSIKENVMKLLNNRDGLMLGICNGFQALIKLGLLPFGKILEVDDTYPTLTFNSISRHQSKIVRTKLVSKNSPWLTEATLGKVYNVPISHGEGRFVASDEVIANMIKNGQIATQYVDFNDNATNDIQFNPNNSDYAIEGILSPDGRIFGKMGHSERYSNGIYKNVTGEYDLKLFESAVKYFK